MHLIAILLVMTAGIMWAGCGLAAQDFFQKSTLDSMDLTVFRMFCASGIMLLVTIAKGQLKDSWQKLGQQPSLWWGLIFYGVVGLMLMHYTYFASIAAGNAVILKPAEATPLMALELAKIFEQAGLPAGLLSVLPGKGSIIGDALARHPKVRKISFTGGTTTGRHLAHVAAEKLIPASLELGGKSPTIVLEDADIEQAARGICYGIFSSGGQACIAGSRLFVHDKVYPQLMARLLELTQGLRVGHPFNAGTHVGPLINDKHRQSVQEYVELAKREGGSVLCGGEIPADPALAAGSYFLPTIIEGLNNQARVCQEEIFGPVVVVQKFKPADEVIALANDSVYGLGGAVFTKNINTAMKVARSVRTGRMWVNTYNDLPAGAPFGGYKQSGIGRETHKVMLEHYSQMKNIFINLKDGVSGMYDIK